MACMSFLAHADKGNVELTLFASAKCSNKCQYCASGTCVNNPQKTPCSNLCLLVSQLLFLFDIFFISSIDITSRAQCNPGSGVCDLPKPKADAGCNKCQRVCFSHYCKQTILHGVNRVKDFLVSDALKCFFLMRDSITPVKRVIESLMSCYAPCNCDNVLDIYNIYLIIFFFHQCDVPQGKCVKIGDYDGTGCNKCQYV